MLSSPATQSIRCSCKRNDFLFLQTTKDNACIYLCFTQATDFKYIDLYQKDK